MIFSDTTNLQGLIQDIDFRSSTDDNDYPIKDKTRNINIAYDSLITFINLKSKKIKWADINLSAPYNLKDYALVSGSSLVEIDEVNKFQRAEVKDSEGKWTEVNLISRENIDGAVQEFKKEDGIPKYITIDGDSLTLYPAPNYSQVDSLRIYDQPEVTLFTSSDTTEKPILPRFASVLLSVNASIDYCSMYKEERLDTLFAKKKEVEEQLTLWLVGRDSENSRLSVKIESTK